MPNIIKENWKLIILVACSIILIPVFIFVWTFHHHHWGNPSDFADFATYFNGMVMPILTLVSVLALIATLLHQQEQSSHQQKWQIFNSYVQRFEMQYERYIVLSRTNFPEQATHSTNQIFSLSEYKYLSDKTNKYRHAKEMIELVQSVREKVNIDNINSVSDIGRRIKFFTDDILLETEGAIDSLLAAYKFADDDHSLILSDLYARTLDMIINLNIWGIITNEEHQKLFKTISPPDFSAKN